jgi:hypothetical protein
MVSYAQQTSYDSVPSRRPPGVAWHRSCRNVRRDRCRDGQLGLWGPPIAKEAAMNEAAMRRSLAELTEVLAFPHRGAEAGGSYAQASDLEGATLEETLDYLRLQVKYLVFDLEATRRENMYLRRMLENRRKDDEPGSSHG